MKKSYRNVSFLAELLINILVFSISCAILAGLFGRASLIARQTREKNFASAEIYTLFETMKARGPAALTVAHEEEAGVYVCRYDKDWRPSVSGEGEYTIEMDVTETAAGTGVLVEVEARAKDKAGAEILTMETKSYHPGRGGSAS